MELPIPEIVDQLDVPTVIALLLYGGYKVLRKLDAFVDKLGGLQEEQRRTADELSEHKLHDREDFKSVHARLDKIAGS